MQRTRRKAGFFACADAALLGPRISRRALPGAGKELTIGDNHTACVAEIEKVLAA